MPEIAKHEPGMFCWVDLMTTDAGRAREFYSRLLECEAMDNPVDDGFVYTMFIRDGKNIAGLFQMTPEMQEQGMPACWNSYVAVENVEEAAERAASLGGAVAVAPMDVMDAGRMASIIDPTGGALGLWEAKRHIGVDLIGEPGAFAWAELYTGDTVAAGKFYADLFGWETQQTVGSGGAPYSLFTSGGAPAAGMLAIQPEWGEVPPNWTVYFAVDNLDEALEKVRALGGSVKMPPMPIPSIGMVALLADAEEVYFMLIELEDAARPA